MLTPSLLVIIDIILAGLNPQVEMTIALELL